MTALDLIKKQFQDARETFEGTVGDITAEMFGKLPEGTALPLEAAYAHLILSEDMTVATFLQGRTPLYNNAWKDKTGVSELMPDMDANWSKNHLDWAKRVKIDLGKLADYKKAVYAQTDTYLSTIKDEDLEKEIDLGAWGKKPLYSLLFNFLIGHTMSLTGEISAAKGLQGAKGYAF